MPAGAEHTGYSSIRAGNGNFEMPLYATGSRNSGFVAGEQATPDGARDCAISPHSVSDLPSGQSYCYQCYGQPFMGMRSESSPDSSSLMRRSSSFCSGELSLSSGLWESSSALRGNRFLSASAYDGPGPVSALSETTVLGGTPARGNTDSHAQALSDLRAENKKLRCLLHQLQQENGQLRGRHSATQAYGAPDNEDPPAHGPWVQLPAVNCDEPATQQRPWPQAAMATGDEHGVLAIGSQAEDAAPPATPPSSSSRSSGASAGDLLSRGRALDSPPLMRLDMPPHTHEAMAPAHGLSVEPDEAASSACCAQQLHQTPKPAASGAPTAAPLAPRDGAGSVGHTARVSRASASGPSLGNPAEAAAAGVATADGFPELHPLLAAERRRTDRAHAALLCISRQAMLLQNKLNAMQVDVERLKEELEDWRRFCLENYKKLMSCSKAMVAGAGKLYQ